MSDMIDAVDVFASDVQERTETCLAQAFSTYPDSEIRRVAKYVALGGGHRWRSLVALATAEVFSDNAYQLVLPTACAIELTHSASLLLDDLPSMDNSPIRRGKPCAHLVFAPWAVDMAPTFLVVMAYKLILDNHRVNYESRTKVAAEITDAGLRMFHGQELDVTGISDQADPEQLLDCYRLKSGALFAVATKAAALLSGASESEVRLMEYCGASLGMSYQHLDDLSDVVRATNDAGKIQGMDADKTTSIDLYGVDGVKQRINQYLDRSHECLERFGARADSLRGVLGMIDWKSW